MLPKSTIFTEAELQMIAYSFWPRVDIKEDECWNWLSYKKHGYGDFYFNGDGWRAHRIAWVLTYGPILDNLCVCHHCDNRGCVNPDHLFLGTYKDNILDAAKKGRHKNPRLRGSKNAMAKLTGGDILEIRKRHANGETQRSIAKDFPVNYKAISKICRRERWRHV